MNGEIKQRWIAALESGEFSQAKGKLHDDSGFCCLGVLCEIAFEDSIVDKKVFAEDGLTQYNDPSNRSDYDVSIPPHVVGRWAEMDDRNPEFIVQADDLPESILSGLPLVLNDKVLVTLAGLNDAGLDFKSIAKIIDKYF